MNAIILNECGGIENLLFTSVDKPEPTDNEVLIQVKAISINPVDYKLRKNNEALNWLYGSARPAILGWDVSGTVVESKSPKFKNGDEVFGMINFPGAGNAYAEYIIAKADHIVLKPTNIDHKEAAAATLAALTAWQVLSTHAKLQAGQKFLVHGASGGVGHYATQLGKHLGAYVIGISSSKNKDFVVKNGADEHIDYNEKRFEDELTDIDLVLDTLGGENILRSIKVAKQGGKVISIVSPDIPQAYFDEASKRGVELSNMMVQSSGTDMKIIADLLEKGSIKSHISKFYPFNELPLAHEQLETGRTVGKLVVTVD